MVVFKSVVYKYLSIYWMRCLLGIESKSRPVGLVEEGLEAIEENGGSGAKDLALTTAAQKMEHCPRSRWYT